MEWTDVGVGQGGQENGQSTESSVNTHISHLYFEGAKVKARHQQNSIQTPLPQTFYQHSNFVAPNPSSSMLEPYSILQLPLTPLRHDKQPHHQFFPIHGQTVDRDQLGLLQDFLSLSIPFHFGSLCTCSETFVILKTVDEQNMPEYPKAPL